MPLSPLAWVLLEQNGMKRLAFTLIGLLTCACRDDGPSAPTRSSIAVTSASPPSGATIVVPERYPYFVPGGVVVPPQSGILEVSLSMTSAHEVPWAQLSVYLVTGPGRMDYCGQNLPDSPTWGFLPAGWTTTYSVTGFSVYRLPCDVTGIRAVLHTRNNGLLIPPTASETIAETVFPVTYQLRR